MNDYKFNDVVIFKFCYLSRGMGIVICIKDIISTTYDDKKHDVYLVYEEGHKNRIIGYNQDYFRKLYLVIDL